MRAWRHIVVVAVALVLVPLAAGAFQGARVNVRLQDGTIIITATHGNDGILVGTVGANVVVLAVDAGGVTLAAFPRAAVDLIGIDAHRGNDHILINHDVRTIMNLHDGDDVVVGSAGYDDIQAGDGRDVVVGRGGGGSLWSGPRADAVVGGSGQDRIFGGMGNDALHGKREDDRVVGMPGNDLLLGGFGTDTMEGRDGNDLMFGGPGPDTMFGGMNDDVLCGGTANDELFGLWGNDQLFGEEQADRHDGGAGNDDLYGDPAVGDVFANGNQHIGNYVCHLELGEPPPVIETSYGAGLMAWSGYLIVQGSPEADVITVVGDESGATVTLQGVDAEPVELRAEAINGPVAVVLAAGDGNDQVHVSGTFASLVMEGGEGDDTLDAAAASYEIAMLLGDGGNDVLRSGGTRSFIAGGEGDDVVEGGDGTDFVNGYPGNDELAVGEADVVLDDYSADARRPLYLVLAIMLFAGLIAAAVARTRPSG